MLSGKASALFAPTERASDSAHLVGSHRFTVARSSEDNRAVALAARHRFGGRTNKFRIVDRLLAERSEVNRLMAEREKERLHGLLEFVARMVSAQRNFHSALLAHGSSRCRDCEWRRFYPP